MHRFATLSARAATAYTTAWLAAARCDGTDDAKRIFTVFLDVDGVLNNATSRAAGDERKPDAPMCERHAPDTNLVQNLAQLMRDAEAQTGREGKIVLSSTWRLKPETAEAVEVKLREAQLAIDGVTPDYGPEATTTLVDANLSSFTEGAITLVPTASEGGGLDRVDEIFSEIRRRKLGRCYLVLDDLNLPWKNARLRREHFVRTRDDAGLTKEKRDEAVAKLVALHENKPYATYVVGTPKFADRALLFLDNGRHPVEEDFAVPRTRLVRFGGDERAFKRNYRETRTIGQGAFGTVKVATHAVTWQQRAVKRMKPDHPQAKAFRKASGPAGAAWDRAFAMLDGRTGGEDEPEWDKFMAFLDNNRGGLNEEEERQPRPPRPASVPAEVRRLCELDHPHVVKLFEYFVDSSRDELLLVQEFLSGGTLLDKVRKKKRFTVQETATTLREMLSAVACCHAHGLLHADLKPDNFVYDSPENGSLKLIDFGLSRDVAIDSHGIRAGNLTFTAPETFAEKGRYGQPADVYSLGCMFFLCLTGEHLIEGLCGGEVVTAFGGVKVTAEDDARKAVCDAKAIAKRLEKKARPLLPAAGYNLLQRMLAPDPQQRITALAALQHAFVARETEFDGDCVAKMRRFAALPALVRLAILVEAHEAAGRDVAQKECSTFEALDRDVDGEVDAYDLRVALLKHGGVVADALEGVFKRCDLSRNGSLSQSEFIAATMSAGLFGTETYRDAAFVALDADADGLITPKDVARLLAPGTAASVARGVLAEIEAGDGVDRATFDALVRAAAASGGPGR